MINPEIIVAYARAPGLATLEQLQQVKAFLLEYQKMRDIYRAAFVVDPVGLTLESNLDQVNWYEDFHAKQLLSCQAGTSQRAGMNRMVWNDPNGTWAIQHVNRKLLGCNPRQAGAFWTLVPSLATKYLTKEDAQIIADGLMQRRAVLQGVACGTTPETQLTVIDITC